MVGDRRGLLAIVPRYLAVTRTERRRYARDALVLKVPVLGETIQYSMVERFCRILGSMVSAGVNLTEALSVTTEALRNRVYIKRLDEVHEQILEGQGIAARWRAPGSSRAPRRPCFAWERTPARSTASSRSQRSTTRPSWTTRSRS